jgi:hypothetical protein
MFCHFSKIAEVGNQPLQGSTAILCGAKRRFKKKAFIEWNPEGLSHAKA